MVVFRLHDSTNICFEGNLVFVTVCFVERLDIILDFVLPFVAVVQKQSE